MSKILKGLKNLNIFPVTVNTASAYTAGAKVAVPGAQSLGITPNSTEWKVYADDTVYESGRDIEGMTLTFQVIEMSLELKTHFEGGTYDAATKEYSFKDTDLAPELALSFAALTSDGQYRMVKIYSLKTMTVSGEYATKGQSGDGSSPITITATVTARKVDGEIKTEKDSVGGVLTWLDTVAYVVPEG